MKLKSQWWIWRSKCTLILAKKIGKKWNLQASWGMEDFTLLSIGARFKKWGCCTPILPKCQAHPHKTKKKWRKIQKLPKKRELAHSLSNCRPRLATSSRPPAACGCPKLAPTKIFFLPPTHMFLHMWSNSCWLAPTHARPAQTSPKIFKYA
jgi:hypothetical protein